jgi:hypothetical protein
MEFTVRVPVSKSLFVFHFRILFEFGINLGVWHWMYKGVEGSSRGAAKIGPPEGHRRVGHGRTG